MKAPLGVAIVGTGSFAETHAAAIHRRSDVRLIGFLGNGRAAADAASARYAVTPFSDPAQLAADDRVQAVVIATPHATHAALAAGFLAAGLHVLVEKPLALSVAECDTIEAAAESSGAICMVGHLMRFAPAHIEARRLIEAGAIGYPVLAESRRVIPWDNAVRLPWQRSEAEGGGMWWIQGVHVIDQLSWLLGGRATNATGTSALRFQDPALQDADDFGTARLGFGPAEAEIVIAGTIGGTAQVYTEVLGTAGRLHVSHRGRLAVDTGAGWAEHEFPAGLDHWSATLDGEWDSFVAAVATGRAEVDADYGRYIVATVEAIKASSSELETP